MRAFDSGRRRFMAGLALFSLLARPSRSLAQSLPDCAKSATVGDWQVTGFDDFWTVKRTLPQQFTITVFDTFTTIEGSSLEESDNKYTLDGTPVTSFAVTVDDQDVVFSSADGFDHFSDTDHDAIVSSFLAGGSAALVISLDDGSRVLLGFGLNGFTRAVNTAKALRDEVARLAAREKCEPLSMEDCFFTTAACGAVGLADDCWELETLRRFRDRTLVGMPHGPADIGEYERVAPAIVSAILAMPDARRRLLGLYWTCIVPCCLLAGVGAARACRSLYAWHFARLNRLIPA